MYENSSDLLFYMIFLAEIRKSSLGSNAKRFLLSICQVSNPNPRNLLASILWFMEPNTGTGDTHTHFFFLALLSLPLLGEGQG